MRYIYYSCFLITVLLLGACQSDAPANIQQTHSESSENVYTITDFAEQQHSFNQPPERIAALSNGEMDIIYALGAELIGKPSSTYSPSDYDVHDIEQVGSTHEIDLEKITLVQPEVVLGNSQMNIKDIPNIESLGAKFVLSEAHSVDGIKRQIQLFGQMLQKEMKAEELVLEIDQYIEALKQNTEQIHTRVLLIYGAPGTYMAALPNSLSGNLVELAGGENIASDFKQLEAYPQYAQINAERIIEANPDYVLLMSHGNPEEVREGFIKEMEQNPAWNQLEAVKEGRIEVLPSDLFGTNPGTRVTDALELLVELFQAAQTK
ncbi:iron-siderophore ABC transporter iron-siderophore-binging protein [Bacillus sp. TS-2]|nr:iron-siderophore ABC transporter iron-siderophore-binging protein [Bacillus sp. TS-2]